MTVKVIGKGTRAGGDAFEYVPGVRFATDLSCRDYDWLVVYDEMSVAEELQCPREHTILATCEPGNFHTLIRPDGGIETKIIDFEPESKMAIPLEAVWPWFRRRKLARKAKRYLRHIREAYGVKEVWT